MTILRRAALLGAVGLTSITGLNVVTAASASADGGVTVPIPGCPITVNVLPWPRGTSGQNCSPFGIGSGGGPFGLLPANVPFPKNP